MVTGLAAVLGVGTWSARILLPTDPYVTAESQRIEKELRDIEEILAQQRVALDAAGRNLDESRDSLEGDRRFLDAIDIVFRGVSARSDSVQEKKDGGFLAPSPPPVGSALWARSREASRFLRRIDWDSAEIASIGTIRANLAPRVGPLLALLSAEKRKWQAAVRWAGASDDGLARWRMLVDAEHSFRAAFHGAAIVVVNYRVPSGT